MHDSTSEEKQKLQAVVSDDVIFEEVDDSYQELIDTNDRRIGEKLCKSLNKVIKHVAEGRRRSKGG